MKNFLGRVVKAFKGDAPSNYNEREFTTPRETGPVYAKEFIAEPKGLVDLVELSKKVSNKSKLKLIERDIALMKYGVVGESNVNFELKHSTLPMAIMHNVRVEYKDFVAQIDFLLISNKSVYILETKRLNGDLTVDSQGNFTRDIKNYQGNVIQNEGMYSPITQVQRQSLVLRKLLQEELDLNIDVDYMVIIANPKTIINTESATTEVKSKIVKYDQLLKVLIDKEKDKELTLEYGEITKIVGTVLAHHKSINMNYMGKYQLTDSDFRIPREPSKKKTIKKETTKEERVGWRIIGGDPTQALKDYRIKTSKERGLKAYMVYSNTELEDLIKHNPKTLEELAKVRGFGKFKVENYGEGILKALKG